ncbi:MAG: hypothetical protein K2H09_10025 [Treponemataceae bacterium]|nr:hypothetical protein [Treponemataceae bacterium]
MDFDGIEEGRPDDSGGLHFYYNREERLARAPEIVREYYAGRGPRPVRGFFRVLVATRGNRFLLFAVVVFMAAVWMFTFLSGRNAASIAGTSAELSAFSYEDCVYASVRLAGGSAVPAAVPVSVQFTAIEASGQPCASAEALDFYEGGELFLRTKITD